MDEWFGRNRCCPAHPDEIPQEYADTPASSSSAVNNITGASGGSETANITNTSSISNGSDDRHEDQAGIFRLDEQHHRENEVNDGNQGTSNISVENGNELLAQALTNTGRTTSLALDQQERLPTTNHINVQESSPVPIQITSNTNSHQRNEINNSTELSPSSSFLQHGNTTTPRSVIPSVEECSSPPIAMSSSAPESSRHKPVVHVDDGSIHGSPNNLDEEEIAQLASKIFVSQQQSPRRYNSSTHSSDFGSRRGFDGT